MFFIIIFYFFCRVTHLPGEPRVQRLRAPFAQERSVLDAFGQLSLGPDATGPGIAHFQVVRHGGRVGGQFEKIETAVHGRADYSAYAADSATAVRGRRFFFVDIAVVVVAIGGATAAAPAPTPVARATAADATVRARRQRTVVVAPTRASAVRIAASTTSIVATACETANVCDFFLIIMSFDLYFYNYNYFTRSSNFPRLYQLSHKPP